MDRNTTIAFVLIGAILVVWLLINTPEPTEQTKKEQDTTIVTEQKGEKPSEIIPEEKPAEILKTDQGAESTLGIFSIAETSTARIITIETDLAIYELSTRGGNFHRIFLKEFNNWYSAGATDTDNYYKNSVQLINNSSAFYVFPRYSSKPLPR